ncbi:cupin domain-containing protein [Streptomyces sp. NPDC090442]|uniref:cupin domain-containing protein n=1 Tax=Streptomyces sp. NPDC090442 TaxID=3365962 RepID=UPI0038014EE3
MIKEIAQGKQSGAVNVKVDGPVQVNFREITLPPGASTGKHCHYGQLIGVVKSGVFTHTAPIYPRGEHVYKAGDSLVEGSGYLHEGRNEGKKDVVLWVTYVTPKGKPLAVPEPGPCDADR